MASGQVQGSGYVLSKLTADPETVTINGPKSLVEKRSSKVEAEVNVSGLSENTVLDSALVLYDENNNVDRPVKAGKQLG